MECRIIKVLPIYSTRQVHIQWEITNPPDGDITIDVLRSGSPNGPFELITTVQNIYYYVDILPGQYGWANVDLYYKISVRAGAQSCTSAAVYYDEAISQEMVEQEDVPPNMRWVYKDPYRRQPRLLRQKLIKDLDVNFKKVQGIPIIILKRKHWGPRCTNCYDPVANTKIKSNCEVCYETGRVGGYWEPVYTWGIPKGSPSVQTITDITGKNDLKQFQMIIPYFPTVFHQDIIIKRHNNERYIVLQKSDTSIRSIPIHQTVVLSLINNDAIEYKIDVDLKWGYHGGQ
jgi:hypothetical protein